MNKTKGLSQSNKDTDDELLASLLEDLLNQSRNGINNLEQVCVKHPELAQELRELWAASQFADVFGRSDLDQPQKPLKELLSATVLLPKFFGEFELLEELGRGGMGVVYKAWQKNLGRMVALKMVLRGGHARPEEMARFQAEAKAIALLEHPNIVPVHEAGIFEEQPYFSMRFVEGQTLATVLAQGPIKPRDAASLIAKITRAVHHAHERGVLHRDLKPSNVIIDQGNNPLVTDFGLAKRIDMPDENPLTQPGAILGTPAYMAPEQVSSSRGVVGPASDVYSLGIILYETLTGRPPFRAASPVDTLLLVLEQDPVRPRLLNPKVDPELEMICLKCLQKQADLRYSSAQDLAIDLEAWVRGETTSVRSGSLGSFSNFFSRMLRDTHHAIVLENWGLLWMMHSVMIFSQCVATWYMARVGINSPWWYILLWGGGLVLWGAIFWELRKQGGPVLFVERQVGHIWAAAVISTIGVFFTEIFLDMPVLKLSPILAIIAGTVFFTKAGILSGEFYPPAIALYLTTIPMALWPEYCQLIFGTVSALCFFIPGLKYHKLRLRSRLASSRINASGGSSQNNLVTTQSAR